jgi:16S rRNA (cytosine967-C5)-methyltransferase
VTDRGKPGQPGRGRGKPPGRGSERTHGSKPQRHGETERRDAGARAGDAPAGRGEGAGGGRGGAPERRDAGAGGGRALAQRVLRRVAGENAFATLALGAALAESGLDTRERRLATELVYGVLRHQTRIDRALTAMTPRGLAKVSPVVLAILRVAAYELLFLDRIPAHAAVSSAVTAVHRLGGARLAGFANGMLRRLAREGEPPLPPASELRTHLVAACSLPPWIVDRLADEVGEAELAAAATALNEPAPLTLRTQRLRTDRTALVERLQREHPEVALQPSPWAPQALLAHGLGDPERSPGFAAGLFTVQDVGAQLVGHLLAPEPGWRVLDACAGVGGKSTHLAELAGDRAVIDAVDISAVKLGLCADAARRLGLSSVRTACVDLTAATPDAWHAAGLADAYDAAVLDAPCTGLGVLRRHPEAKLRLAPDDIGRLSALQSRLLEAVAARVRPGGVLVYSVCTFTREEGPERIAAFLAAHPDFALEPPPTSSEAHAGSPAGAEPAVAWRGLAGAGAGEGSVEAGEGSVEAGEGSVGAGEGAGPAPAQFRTWPHRHGADGFFLARLRRRA